MLCFLIVAHKAYQRIFQVYEYIIKMLLAKKHAFSSLLIFSAGLLRMIFNITFLGLLMKLIN